MPLDLPAPDHTLLPGAALPLVVCQVRFDDQPGVSESLLGRQFLEHLADEYPTVGQMRAEQITLGVGLLAGSDVRSTPRRGWRAASVDGSWSVALLPDSVSLETQQFTSFDDFRDRLGRVLTVTSEFVQPAVAERVGLRFVNLIPVGFDDAESGSRAEVWSAVLSESLRGPSAVPGLVAGMLMMDARALYESPSGAKATVRWALGDPQGVLIDIDAYIDVPGVFTDTQILEHALNLNNVAVQLFQASISEETRDRLRGVRA